MPLLFSIILSINRGWVQRKKQVFLSFFDNPLSKYLIFERVFASISCFELFTQLKRGLGLAFGPYFLPKNCPWLNTSTIDYVSISDLVSFSRYQSISLNPCLANWWCHKFRIYLHLSTRAKADRREKRGKGKYKNLNILRMKKLFLWNTKSIFIIF